MRRTTVRGIVLLVIGIPLGIGLIVFAIGSTAKKVDALQRVQPQGGVITATQAGDITIYAETNYVVGKGTPQPKVDVAVGRPGGSAAKAQPYDGNATYNLSGHSGIAISTINLPGAGTYFVTVGGADAKNGIVDVALGPAVHNPVSFILPLIAGILVLVGALVGGILSIVLGRRATSD